MGTLTYVAMLVFVLVATLPLELVLRTRVYALGTTSEGRTTTITTIRYSQAALWEARNIALCGA